MVNGITCILNCIDSNFTSCKWCVEYQTRSMWFSDQIYKAMVLRDNYNSSKQIALCNISPILYTNIGEMKLAT